MIYIPNGGFKMKKYILLILSIAILFSLTACSSTGKEANGTLSIGVLPDVDSVPIIIADNEGYFKENNLNVEIHLFHSAMDRDAALQSRKIDGAVSDMLAALYGKEGGFNVKITSKTNGSYKLITGKNSYIKNISELAGRGIALSKNTVIEYAADSILSYSGVDVSSINKIVIPQIPTRLEMLRNGQVAAAVLPEPMASVAINEGASLLASTDTLGINPGILLFTEDSISTKTSELKKFYKAYNKAVDLLNKEDVKTFADILVQKAGFPEEFKNSPKLVTYEKAALPSEEEFNNINSWMKNNNQIKSEFKYSDVVYDEFVK